MVMAAESKGVRSEKQESKPAKVWPHNPDLKHMSAKEAEAYYKQELEADKVAEEAKAKFKTGKKASPVDESPSVESDKVASLRSQLASIEKNLVKKPGDEKLLKKKNKVAEALDQAEEASE